MLTRRLAAMLAAAVLTHTAAPLPASADPPVDGSCRGLDCEVIGEVPGDSDDHGDSGTGGKGAGGGGCSYKGQTVPCSIGLLGWFNSADGCYYHVSPPPPPGLFEEQHTGETGNWYTIYCGMYDGGPGAAHMQWVPGGPLQPPPNPEDLARRALAKITLKGAAIGMAPRPGTAGLVYLPVWMWTEVTPNTWGPISASESAGGLTVTITAKAERIDWSMGDGNTISCANPGTAFRAGDGGKRSPTACDHVYTKPSRNERGGKYAVTATTAWRVDWSGGGQSGVINQSRTSTTNVQIDELQVVNR